MCRVAGMGLCPPCALRAGLPVMCVRRPLCRSLLMLLLLLYPCCTVLQDEELISFLLEQPALRGAVEGVRVVRDKATSVGKGFAFVLFKTQVGGRATASGGVGSSGRVALGSTEGLPSGRAGERLGLVWWSAGGLSWPAPLCAQQRVRSGRAHASSVLHMP